MRWPELPDLPVQESWSVKTKTMKNSLLDEEFGSKAEKSFPEDVSCQWRVLLAF
jgi:hypothetical protein